jgi:hypothetical protein
VAPVAAAAVATKPPSVATKVNVSAVVQSASESVASQHAQHKENPTCAGDGGVKLQRVRWTQEEENALQRGILKHGVGNWSRILRDQEFKGIFHASRDNVALKDKHRNIVKASSKKN